MSVPSHKFCDEHLTWMVRRKVEKTQAHYATVPFGLLSAVGVTNQHCSVWLYWGSRSVSTDAINRTSMGLVWHTSVIDHVSTDVWVCVSRYLLQKTTLCCQECILAGSCCTGRDFTLFDFVLPGNCVHSLCSIEWCFHVEGVVISKQHVANNFIGFAVFEIKFYVLFNHFAKHRRSIY